MKPPPPARPGPARPDATIEDTRIHFSYLIRSGERNRALTIIKSRGARHLENDLARGNSGMRLRNGR